ncbi:MAG: DUF1329 domain-containing protein [Proteobacteria bacterium]|nr:DUF1329 domain-containing protein [Pseudomonadota bacterium]
MNHFQKIKAHVRLSQTVLSCWLATILFGAAASLSADEFDIDRGAIDKTTPPIGTVIGPDNVDSFLDVLDPDLAALISQDWLTITVGQPLSFRPYEAYVGATEQYGNQTSLGSNPGELMNYVAGRPFPGVPTTDDPRAGEKLAWNMRYGYSGDAGEIPEMYWQYIDMRSQKVERELEFVASQMRFKHRHVIAPVPELEKNPYDVYNAITLEALDPGDVAKTKLLIFYNSDDTQAEQGWMYVPLLRRVRRVATTARTDSFLGSDITIEDFLGYSGRIMDMDWEFKGTTYTLLPMYTREDIQPSTRKARKQDYNFVDFHGHSGCFPNVTWQLRKSYILEGRPKRSDHPIGRRYFYIDAQTMFPIFGKVYDKADVLWKYLIGGLAHPDTHIESNRGSGVPMIDSSSVIDVQSKHCTTIQLMTLTNLKSVKRGEFDPSSLNVGAR